MATASAGVTSGSTFCGVVGHAHRHEYTVIGRTVNLAARLMIHYPGTLLSLCSSKLLCIAMVGFL